MQPPFEVRGVVEGFYGPPWSHDARRTVMTFLAERGMNAYVYAPKDDAFHRARWRDPYPDEEFGALVDLRADLARVGVRTGYALSPGLDVDYGSPDDRRALGAKLSPFVDAGFDWLVLAFDDVPLRASSGKGQAELARWLGGETGAHVSVVPTDYVGTRPTPYLDELASGLPDDTDVWWTGASVVTPTISAEDARSRREATLGQPVVVWDNYPVNDAFMSTSLHLGPMRGRAADLGAECHGFLANPMIQPLASLIALATVADYAREPAGYDADASWASALADVCVELGAGDGLGALARACAASGLESRVPLHDLVDALERGEPSAAEALREEFAAVQGAAGDLPPGLTDEARPWLEQAAREATAGLAALALLRPEREDDPWARVLAVMGALLAWNAARADGRRVAYGARFACYPGIIQLPDGSTGVDPALCLVEDENAVDRLCRLALGSVNPAPAR